MITPRSPAAFGSPRAMAAAASRMTLNVPIRFTLMTRTKSASGCGPLRPSVRWATPMPAQLIAPCSPPNASSAWSTACCTLASSVTSVRAKRTLSPSCEANCSPAAALTSATTTRAPPALKRRAQAAPRPEAPPLIKKVRPSSCMALWNQRQGAFASRGEILAQHVMTPHAAFEAGYQADVSEPGQVVTDGRLAQVEGGGEVAHADGLGRGLEQVQHLHARRIGERLEQGGELVGGRGRQRRGEGGGAAPCAGPRAARTSYSERPLHMSEASTDPAPSAGPSAPATPPPPQPSLNPSPPIAAPVTRTPARSRRTCTPSTRS